MIVTISLAGEVTNDCAHRLCMSWTGRACVDPGGDALKCRMSNKRRVENFRVIAGVDQARQLHEQGTDGGKRSKQKENRRRTRKGYSKEKEAKRNGQRTGSLKCE